ncbi:MAG: alkaline phosphatase family protein, partial [Verrucomicrobia bacterium]|nr:alkaline phosphatase family protein [Verrucomicrobiota bacterium]
MKRFLPLFGLFALIGPLQAEKPKLVVAILVDQFCYDYLERFHDQFVEGGLRRLTDHGAFMTYARYDYCPTVTGPGHASFLSGSPPSIHGIIGNDWFDKATGQSMYCCKDASVTGVGTQTSAGQMSP